MSSKTKLTGRQLEIANEALLRAQSSTSQANWILAIHGFMAKGIPEDQIEPTVNVLTYHAWRAKGRQVRKGEHGVKLTTYVARKKEVTENGVKKEKIYKMPWTATVFHVSQTDPIQMAQAS